jgi:hypothetical protein
MEATTIVTQGEPFAARYGQAFKDNAVAKLLPPQSAPIEVVARELSISPATLERWRAQALSTPTRQHTWTAAARFDAILDDRPDRYLRLGEQLLDGIGQQMGGRVTNNLHTFGIAVSNDRQIDVAFDQTGSVDQIAIHLAGQCGAGQSGADTGSHFGNGDGLLIGADGTIGQFDIGHGGLPGKIWTKKKCGASRTFLLTKLTRLRFLNFDTSSEQHYQPHQEFW